MDAETRTHTAITITRGILKKALDSPFTMVEMTWFDIDPDAVEDEVERILCYLEKTAPEKPEEGLGIDTIKEDLTAQKPDRIICPTCGAPLYCKRCYTAKVKKMAKEAVKRR